jgi:hypothetical protein
MQGSPFAELAREVGATWAWVIYGLLAVNILPILVIAVAGPRRWARALAVVHVQVDLYLVWLALGVGSAGLLTDARLLPCLAPFFILLAQFTVLLLVSRWRLHMKSYDVDLRP